MPAPLVNSPILVDIEIDGANHEEPSSSSTVLTRSHQIDDNNHDDFSLVYECLSALFDDIRVKSDGSDIQHLSSAIKLGFELLRAESGRGTVVGNRLEHAKSLRIIFTALKTMIGEDAKGSTCFTLRTVDQEL